MKDRIRSQAAIWLRSWGSTFGELKHFVERHYKFVLAALAITYVLIWGGMYLQYQIVKAKDGSDYLRYKTIVVKDVVQNHDEFNNRFPQAEIRYIPQIQQQVIVVPAPNTDQAKQQTTSGNGNGNANAPGQLKKGK